MWIDMLIVGIPIASYAAVLWLAWRGQSSSGRRYRWP